MAGWSRRVADESLEPILEGPGASDYERYLRTDELLALQKAPEEMAHRDELLFQTVHQSSELWLKHASFEVETAVELIRERDVWAAVRLLRRACLGISLVTEQLRMLEQMSPWEYQEVRRVLGHGSGFDSPGFARIRRVAPLLGQEFAELVRERGLTLVELYRRGREHEELYQLAERVLEWDELLTLWRIRHLKVVERIIGGEVVGTQGTPVELLAQLIHRRFYPELWNVRNALTELATTEDASRASSV
jgi:tryptophan 2,3-dioxygenase